MPLKPIGSVLIANRGEIACRVIRTCRTMGIRTVAVYSTADADAMFVHQADEAHLIGPPKAADSYLNMKKIIDVCKKARVDAVHPGYGFLSENGDFARMCEDNGITFIGPLPDTMALLGNKASVKNLLTGQKDVPLIPGYSGADQSTEALVKEATRIGCPVLVKATNGGGGKGMRVVDDLKELEETIASVQREASSSFGSADVLLERYFRSCRHVEIQIFGDKHGTIIALGERDCSVQRRFQKVVEENPSPIMTTHPTLRKKMCQSAIAIGKLSNYIGAGTVEFLVEPDGTYFFLEVNTRLQVEHPITESVYGVDLVQWQIEVAMGKRIEELKLLDGTFARNDLPRIGHAVECRLYAEDPSNNYFPCIGTLLAFEPYEGEGLRFDTGVTSGSEISVHYDPMIAKFVSFGPTREVAIQRMIRSLSNTMIAGVVNNQRFLVEVLRDPVFQSGNYDTGFLGKYFTPKRRKQELTAEQHRELGIVATLWQWSERMGNRSVLTHIPPGFTNGLGGGYASLAQLAQYRTKKGELISVKYNHDARAQQRGRRVHGQPQPLYFTMQVGKEAPLEVELVSLNKESLAAGAGACTGSITCRIGKVRRKYRLAVPSSLGDLAGQLFVHSDAYGCHSLTKQSLLSSDKGDKDGGGPNVTAPMPSKVFQILVKVGDEVKKGKALVVLESMKMEVKVAARAAGIVKSIHVKEGQVIKDGAVLMVVEPVKAPVAKL